MADGIVGKVKDFFNKPKEAEQKEEEQKEDNLSKQFSLSDDKKKAIVETIIAMRDEAEQSRGAFMAIREECVKRYEGLKESSDVPWPDHCLSKDTDILTKRGWINITELREDDIVYSMNPDSREAYWMPVIGLVRHYYEEMIYFKGKSIDLIVSPEHKMIVETKGGKSEFKTATEIATKKGGWYIPLVSDFKHYQKRDEFFNFRASDWMEFLGWYISEGYTSKSGTIGICQSREKNPLKCRQIELLLDRMKLRWSYSTNSQYLVSCKTLPLNARTTLKEIGKAHTKHIPREYLEQDPTLLRFLLDSLMAGDGCTRKRGGNLARAYYTVSKQLADDVQELLQKIGLRGRISKHITKGRFKINGKDTSRTDIYAVEIGNKDRIQCNKLQSTKVPYGDYAYCLETPFHTIYVRRNGVAVWTSQSNISTMVTTVACDLLHAKLYPMAWNASSLYWEGTEEHDIETASANKVVMSWVTSTDMELDGTIDDIIHCLVIDGTIAVKKIWKTYWVWVTRKIPDGLEYYATDDGNLNVKPKFKITRDYIRRERCYLEIRPLEHVYIPYDANTYEKRWEDTAEYIIDERWFTLPMLRELQHGGALDPNLDLGKQGQTSGIIKAGLSQTEEYKGTQRQRMEAEGVVPPTDIRQENHKLKCLEAEILYDINDDGIREKCVFLICEDLKLYMSGKPLHAVSRVGRSSWVIRPFLRRPGRAYGKSVPELVRHLHDELDAIHNQRIDAGNMLIAPFFFYRSASGTPARRIIAAPATGIPLDDPDRDVRFPTFPSNGLQVSFQEERLVMELIERLTYLTPAMMGRETASRPTARGTLAVISQGEQKFGLIGARVQGIICAILTDVRQQYEENMPPDMWSRILGKENIHRWPSPEYMLGGYEAKMQLDLTAMDMDADRQFAVAMYQTMAFDPLVMQNPAFMWEIRADYLKAMRRTPVEKYIGPRPQTEMSVADAEGIFAMIEQEMVNIPLGDPTTLIPRLKELRKTRQLTPEANVVFNDYMRKLQTTYMEGINRGIEQYANIAGQGQGVEGAGNAPGLSMPYGQNMGSAGPRTLPTGGMPGGGPNAQPGGGVEGE